MTTARRPPVRLVEAGRLHAPVLAALHAACFDDPWSEAEMAKLLATPGTRAVIASEGATGCHGDSPVAFAMMRAVADECEILTIGVVPAWRRRGVGRRLLLYCQDMAAGAGAGRMILEVGEFNRAAVALYGSLGYVPVGHRPGYYRGRDGRREAGRILAYQLTRS